MFKDVITYELAEGITEEHLSKVARQIVNDWMKKLPGFEKWEIHSNGDGHYTDLVYWRSKADADNANKEMANIPNAGAWYACYKEGTISGKKLTLVDSF